MKSIIQEKAKAVFDWEKTNMVKWDNEDETVIILVIHIPDEPTDIRSFNGLVLYSSHEDYNKGYIVENIARNKFIPYNGKIILEND